ncbi:MAG: hypothetical protein JETT_3456 [Candidatus Jettenia ecosi]|uniref:Uncharacterized protein n=1 Tax=Candidatus Jettenia ecosi TaxID=2494326 RepID=A0A533QCE0_9BACT|nr:MAG: hypothetical protein JETT_3456 [Candidatus Jettenia ecosi]
MGVVSSKNNFDIFSKDIFSSGKARLATTVSSCFEMEQDDFILIRIR